MTSGAAWQVCVGVWQAEGCCGGGRASSGWYYVLEAGVMAMACLVRLGGAWQSPAVSTINRMHRDTPHCCVSAFTSCRSGAGGGGGRPAHGV